MLHIKCQYDLRTMNSVLSKLGRRPLVCLVTDRHRLPESTGDYESRKSIVELVRQAGQANIDLVQIRERDLCGHALMELVKNCIDVVRGTSTKIIVNDRLDVALAAGASGVHLRSDSVQSSRVRAMTPPGFILGRSVHDLKEADLVARNEGLDYLILGSVFCSPSTQTGRAPIGVSQLSQTVRSVSLPVLAIGGITLKNVEMVARTGAAGVAAIGLFSDCLVLAEKSSGDRLKGVVEIIRRSFDSRDPVV